MPVAWKRRGALFLREPTVHFFVVGALLFLAHRLIVGDQRVIFVHPGVKADLQRRFRDRSGRLPGAAELDDELRGWQRDEALYREALRDRLDRDDAAIRTILADRMRARAALERPAREPTAADLERWLATHRGLYETPRRYDYQLVTFARAQPSAARQLQAYQKALKEGADPAVLGQPVVGGDLTAEALGERFGPELAARIQSLPIGAWRPLDSRDQWLLVRLNAIAGGLPRADQLRSRLVADWSFAEQQHTVDQAVQAIVDRYRFEQRP